MITTRSVRPAISISSLGSGAAVEASAPARGRGAIRLSPASDINFPRALEIRRMVSYPAGAARRQTMFTAIQTYFSAVVETGLALGAGIVRGAIHDDMALAG